MPQQMFVEKLHRLTLVRKGRGVAKHPDMREGVLEVVKSEETDPLDGAVYDWYEDFAAFIRDTPADDVPEDWELAFAERESATLSNKESAKKKNYPDGAGPFAGPHNSFPISSQHHVYAAAKLIGHASNPAAVKAAIIRIAHQKGYSLPKSWQKKTQKAEETPLKPEVVDAALAALRTALLPEGEVPQVPEVIEEPKVSSTPAEPETPVVDAGEGDDTLRAEKASTKAQPHNHDHAHASTYGYTYSHGHVHGDTGHADAEDHSTSETLHAHVHVAKSDDHELDGLLADVAGLKQDLDASRAEVETLKAELASVQEAKTAAEDKQASAEVKAQDLYKNLLRRPLTAPTQTVEKSDTPITKETPWDEAFAIALGRK